MKKVVGIFGVCALIFIIVFYHDVIFDLERQDVKTVECFGISFEIPTKMEEFYEDNEYAFFSINNEITAKDDFF